MSGLFGSKTYDDPELGTLTRSGRHWKVSIPLPHHGAVQVRISGSRSSPDADALALARQLAGRYEELMPAIAAGLFDHYEPYGEENAGSEALGEAPPRIGAAPEVWSHVEVDEVLIGLLDGKLSIEIAYLSAWDEEHRLGARIREWRLVELNGSV